MLPRSEDIRKSTDMLRQLPGTEVRIVDRWKVKRGILHKMIVVDGSAAYLGSANFDWKAMNQIKELGFYIKRELS